MNEIAVSVIAAFNTLGECKPRYLKLETPDHQLRQYAITSTKEAVNNYAGITYLCIYIDHQQKEHIIKLRYSRDLMKWFLVGVIK